MHPAISVILFTTLSGMGFGLFVFLGFGAAQPQGLHAFVAFGLAYALAGGGLLASTFHLGNPQRFLRAFSQWRTSWLSREAWASVAALLVFAPVALSAVFLGKPMPELSLLGALLAVLTVQFTSMIYAQLKTVPRWRHWTTPALFLAFSLTGGAILLAPPMLTVAFCVVLGGLMGLNFWLGDARFKASGTDIGTATGLGGLGSVRAFEPPHTGTNYLMREMIHVVGRKHVIKLRVIAVVFAAVLPALLVALLPASIVAAALAAMIHLVGALAARWLFFAEAEHVVGLYYGKR